MKAIIQSVSALALGVSSLAFTAPANADSGLTLIYSSHGYGYRGYPVKSYYYTGKPVLYGRACAVKPRHHHYRHDYGHHKHDRRHDKHARRGHDRGYRHRDRDRHEHRSHRRDDSHRTHTGYARLNRH